MRSRDNLLMKQGQLGYNWLNLVVQPSQMKQNFSSKVTPFIAVVGFLMQYSNPRLQCFLSFFVSFSDILSCFLLYKLLSMFLTLTNRIQKYLTKHYVCFLLSGFYLISSLLFCHSMKQDLQSWKMSVCNLRFLLNYYVNF